METTTTLGAITPDKQALLDALANTQKSLDVEVRRQEARADAVEVLDKTGKLPSQLLQERDDLVEALREMMKHCHFDVTSTVQGKLYNEALKRSDALLSKYPKT